MVEWHADAPDLREARHGPADFFPDFESFNADLEAYVAH